MLKHLLMTRKLSIWFKYKTLLIYLKDKFSFKYMLKIFADKIILKKSLLITRKQKYVRTIKT